MAIKSLRVCLLKMSLFHLHIWSVVYPVIEQFVIPFFLQKLNILFQYLLAFIVFGEKSAIYCCSSHIKWHFSLNAFKSFSLAFFLQFNCDFSRSDFIFISFWGFVELSESSFLPNLGRFWWLVLQIFILSSLSEIPVICMLGCFILSCSLWNLVYFYSNIFHFFGWIISVDLYSGLSAISKLSLSLFKDFSYCRFDLYNFYYV